MDKAIPVPGRNPRQVRVAWSYLNKTSCVERETLHNYCNLEIFWVQPITLFFLFMMIFTDTVFYSILSFIFSYQKIEMGFRAKLLQYLEPRTHHLIVILSTSLLSGPAKDQHLPRFCTQAGAVRFALTHASQYTSNAKACCSGWS